MPVRSAALPADVDGGTVVVEAYATAITGKVIRHPLRLASHPANRRPNTLTRYLQLVDALGLADPAGAVELRDRCDDLRRRARDPLAAVKDHDVRGAAAAALASGDIDPDTPAGARALLGAVTPDDQPAVQAGVAGIFRTAADTVYADALHAVRAQDDWHNILAHLADEALDNAEHLAAADRWDNVHALAELLRSLGALTAAEGAHPMEYRVARPDLVHLWRLEHAKSVRPRAHTTGVDDRGRAVMHVVRTPRGAPAVSLVRLAEHRDEWHPGLYTGEQVVANVKALPHVL